MKWVYRVCVLNVMGLSWALAATWPTCQLGQSPPDSLRAFAGTPHASVLVSISEPTHYEQVAERITGVITVALKQQSLSSGAAPATQQDNQIPSLPSSEPNTPDQSASPPEPTAPQTTPQHPRVIAYCVFSGVSERFVITSDEKLLKISENGEVALVGIITAPISGDYFCMIRTEKWVIGVSKKGHLVSLISGAILGAVIPLE